jgi:hypothetical protein
MNYAQWLTKISIANRVVLTNWPPNTLYNVNEFKLPLLRKLRDGIDAGKIRYQEMTDEEHATALELVANGHSLDRSPAALASTPGNTAPSVAAAPLNALTTASAPSNAVPSIAAASNAFIAPSTVFPSAGTASNVVPT